MPLVVPEQHVTYRFIGIDPGLSNLGVAIFDIDYYTDRILRIEAFTLVNDKLPNHTGFDVDTVTERTVKLYKLRDSLQNLLCHYNPSHVVSEAPFYNRFMPMAFGALNEVVAIVHNAVLCWNPNVGFHTVPPLTVKKLVNTKAVKNDTVKGKELVKLAISSIPEIMSVLVTPIDTLSEHAIDAVAVGYSMFSLKG